MINSCKEFALSDVAAIVAIPVANYTPDGSITISPTIASTSFEPTLDTSVITIGIAAEVGSLIPIKHATGKVKDSEQLSVAGRLHTVSVDCEVDDRDGDVWTLLQALERTPAHLVLMSREGTKFFVQGSDDTYQCTVGRDGEKTTVSFKVQCIMGLQLIV